MKKVINESYEFYKKSLFFKTLVTLFSFIFILYPALTIAFIGGSRAGVPSGGNGSPCNSSSECGGGSCDTYGGGFCLGGSAEGGGGNYTPGSAGPYTSNYAATYTTSYNSGRAICIIKAYVNNITGHVTFWGSVINRVPLTYATPDFYPQTSIHLYDNKNPIRDPITEDYTAAVDSYDAGYFTNGNYNAANTGATVEGTAYGPVDPSTHITAEGDCVKTVGDFVVNVPSPKPDLTTYAITPNPATVDASGNWSVVTGMTEKFTAWIKNIGSVATPWSFPYFFQVANSDYSIITDLTSGMMSSLGAFQYAQATSPSYTFSSAGNYFVRICANKSSDSVFGPNINSESDLDNNCGNWTPVTVTEIPSTTASATATGGSCDTNSLYISWPYSAGTTYKLFRVIGGVPTGPDLCAIYDCANPTSGYIDFFDSGNNPSLGLTPDTTYTYSLTASN